jgi:hypothetical protein
MHVELQGGVPVEHAFGPKGFLQVHGVASTVREAILLLVAALRDTPSDENVTLQTHMHQLGLSPSEDFGAREYVKVMAVDVHMYFIEYLVPHSLSPWPYAWMKGEAFSVEEAATMVLQAMKFSGGWAA